MKHLLLLIAVCMSLGSCSTIDYLSVDTLMPADVSFAPEVKRVAILNNTVSPAEESNKAPLLNTTLQAEGKNVCERLAEYIANANYFEQVIISDSMLRTDGSDTQAAILSPRQVLDWTRDLQVDMLFVVDDASIQTKSTFAYTTDSGEERVPVVSGALSLETHVYLPGRDRPFQHFLDRDTIYWEADGLTRKQIREDAVEYLAQLPVSHITPLWDTVERYYFRGGSINMRDAAVALQENDWELARQSWEAEYHTKKGKNKARAAFNLALYHEMNDNSSQAMSYLKDSLQDLEKSGKTASTEWLLTKTYLEELQHKDMTRQKLDLQMKRFKQ